MPWWVPPALMPLAIVAMLTMFVGCGLCMLIAQGLLEHMFDARPWMDLAAAFSLLLGATVTLTVAFTSLGVANRISDPAWWASRSRRAGLCLWCRYDLRGSASDRCPECGARRDG